MEEEKDAVVNEIPVYLSKQLTEQLYVYQYPLRPPTSKYDSSIIKTCAMKPLHQEVKVDISLNINSVNFDMSKAEEIVINTDGATGYREKENEVLFENDIMDKQSFISSKAVENCSKYAVGVVHGNEIHITPLKGIVQLRPRPYFPYLDRSDKQTREAEKAASMEEDIVEDQAQQVTVKFARTENERLKKIREKSFNFLSQKSEEEPWCHTKWHHPQSDAAELERNKLLAENQDNVELALDVSGKNYLRMLVPRGREEAVVLPSLPAHVLSLNELKSLTLLEQCRLILKNVKIISFQQLMLLLAGVEGLNTETVLRTLPQVATVIRGCWIVRSDILYPKDTHSGISGVPAHIMCRAVPEATYLFNELQLNLFTQKQYVDRRKVSSVIKLPAEEIKEIFVGIARLRHNKGWELLLPTDHAFIEKYPDVVQRQQPFWEAKQKQFNDLISDQTQKRQRRKSTQSEEVKSNGIKRDRSLDGVNNSDSADMKSPSAKKPKSVHNKTDNNKKITDESMDA